MSPLLVLPVPVGAKVLLPAALGVRPDAQPRGAGELGAWTKPGTVPSWLDEAALRTYTPGRPELL